MKKQFNFFIVAFFLILSFTLLPAPKSQAATGNYWIKVNKLQNVATVYQMKSGKWVPIKAMLTSCGGSRTPSGTFHTTAKYRWKTLMGPSYGQYSMRIYKGILFHSVWYYSSGNRRSQSVTQFNRLGSTASHGCVRLSTQDCKWIYDNCKVGVKVTIYSSSNPGPLGKPAAYKMPSSAGSRNWDPTDASPNNKYYQGLPVLEQKVSEIPVGSSTYNTARKLVTATQTNKKAIRSLKVTTKKYSTSKKKYVSSSFDNKKPGKYQITYTLTGSSGVYITKTFTFNVVEETSEE